MKNQSTRNHLAGLAVVYAGRGDTGSAKDPAINILIDENRSLGLWMAFVRRDGQAIAVIMESSREIVIAAAHSWKREAKLMAA